MKQHLGIDIAKHEHALGAKFEDGERHGKAFAFANDEGGFASLLDRLRELEAASESSLVAMESTGHYRMAPWGFLVAHGHEVAIVNPVLTDAFRKADTPRKTRTGQVGAFLVAEHARLRSPGPTRVSPEGAGGLERLTRYRRHLVSGRTALKNRLTPAADRISPEPAGLFSDEHPAAARAILDEHGTAAKVAAAGIRTLTKTVKPASRGRHGRAKAGEVEGAAGRSAGTPFAAEALAFEARRATGLISHLDGEVAGLDGEVARLLDPEVGALPQPIPGIGPVCAATIAAEVGGPGRLDEPKKPMAYAGVDSTKFQSGKSDGDERRMPKRGPAPLRNALVTAAGRARMDDPHFGDYCDSLGARGKHRYVAVSGCARKPCGVILAVLRERRPYESRPSTQSQQEQPERGRVPPKPDKTPQPCSPPGLAFACPETSGMRILYPMFDCQSSI